LRTVPPERGYYNIGCLRKIPSILFRTAPISLLLLCCCIAAYAQPSTLPNTQRRDTSKYKTNDGRWKNEETTVTYGKLNSQRSYIPDTNVHTFHRRPFVQPWSHDMGNPGSPVNNLMFTPEYRVGPSLGYHVFDVYRFNVDSLNYYTTTRPYSVFSYQTAGRQEHVASIMHTQNIRPNWNFAVEYRKINSPGYYQIQRNNHDNFALTTNYKSLNKHYDLKAAMVYNKQQHDENGGVLYDTALTDPNYRDRRTLNTAYESHFSTTRSSVSNVQRDFTLMLQHSYTWGVTDTFFDEEDTAAYTYTVTPRFSITHNTTISTEKHQYKDMAPDSMRYISLFTHSFANNGTGYYAPGIDSVFTQQKWFWADSKILFNGYIGKPGKQLQFSAGAGARYDQFISTPVTIPITDTPYSTAGYDRRSLASTFAEGQIKKEALSASAWEYGASARLYTSGQYAGNFALNAAIGKKLERISGSFLSGFTQQLGSAPYGYTNYQNLFTNNAYSLNTESKTTAYTALESQRIRASIGARAYVINNYIYINDKGLPAQYTAPFTIPQVWGRKMFRVGSFYLDNELVYQVVSGNTPVNAPAIMGRHQLSFEKALFNNAIKIATGVECRYNTAYAPAGYNAQLNRFFYQTRDTVVNTPELAVFLNFKIKRFRAFVMGDNLQQLFARNAIIYTASPVISRTGGASIIPVFAAPNTMLRFGFSWAMVN